MQVLNISKNGTIKYQLKDGRFIYSYNSGYVRIDSGLDRLYQINKVRTVPHDRWGEVKERILIPCPQERFEYIKAWVSRNVGDIPYNVVRKLRALEFYKKEFNVKYY